MTQTPHSLAILFWLLVDLVAIANLFRVVAGFWA